MSAPLTTWLGSREAIPYVTRRPNGASAPRLSSNTRPPAISSTTSTGSPRFASTSAAPRSSRVTSTAASAPSSSASARFSSVDAVAITRPAPQRLGELDRERADPAGRGVHDDARPGASFAEVRNRCHAVSPCRSSASAVASETPSGIANHRGGGRGDVLRVAAGADERDDPLAGLEAAAVLLHDARDLRARRQRQLVAREIGVLAGVRVGEVDARARDADEHVVLVGLRALEVLDELEDVGPAPFADPDRAHGPEP